jgi:DNA-binding PadR family transcriptional regulator
VGTIELENALPLPPHMFLVLLVLNGGPAHGYGIKKAVAERSRGTVDLDAGGLYRLIARLEERGWVSSIPGDGDPAGDSRRKYYGLTPTGREILAAEARRVSALATAPDVVELARGDAG